MSPEASDPVVNQVKLPDIPQTEAELLAWIAAQQEKERSLPAKKQKGKK